MILWNAGESSQQEGKTVSVSSWPVEMKLPPGSQLPNGAPVPLDAVPQADGTVKLSNGSIIPADDVTLPDGIKLSMFLSVSGEALTPSATMPDGSAPARLGEWQVQFGMPSEAVISLPSVTWPFGFKVPKGTQRIDGSLVPEDAVPQSDGTLKLADGTVIIADDVILPDGMKLSVFLNLSGEDPTPAQSMPDGSKPSPAGGWRRQIGLPEVSVASISWPFGFKLPQGSQSLDGTQMPEDAVPQLDGSVKIISDGTIISAEDVILPDGMKLSALLKPSTVTPKPVEAMPDGSAPSKIGEWRYQLPSMPDLSLLSFRWLFGAMLPRGSQLSDGSLAPDGAVPQRDGTVQLSDGTTISAEDLTLPDGLKLSAVLNPSTESLHPAKSMPDGSAPAKLGSWLLQLRVLSTKASSFRWQFGFKLPQGSQRSDGSVIPDNAVPQPDGTVELEDGTVIPAEDVILPDGVTLSLLLNPSGKSPVAASTMPDGSAPVPVGEWALRLATPSMPTFSWLAGVKLPDGCQLPDGSPVPADAVPQADGTVLFADGTIIAAADVTLPDGTKLIDIEKPDVEKDSESTMPDGSKPPLKKQRTWRWIKYII